MLIVSDIAIFVLKRDVKLQLTNFSMLSVSITPSQPRPLPSLPHCLSQTH